MATAGLPQDIQARLPPDIQARLAELDLELAEGKLVINFALWLKRKR